MPGWRFRRIRIEDTGSDGDTELAEELRDSSTEKKKEERILKRGLLKVVRPFEATNMKISVAEIAVSSVAILALSRLPATPSDPASALMLIIGGGIAGTMNYYGWISAGFIAGASANKYVNFAGKVISKAFFLDGD